MAQHFDAYGVPDSKGFAALAMMAQKKQKEMIIFITQRVPIKCKARIFADACNFITALFLLVLWNDVPQDVLKNTSTPGSPFAKQL